MKIGLVGSLPPHKDGIADHNNQLFSKLLELSDHDFFIIPSIGEVKNYPKKLIKYTIVDESKIKQHKFNIIHLQFGNSFPNSYVFKIFKLFQNSNTNMVVTLHDTTNTNLAKILRTIRSDPSKLIYEINRPSIERIVRRADKIIVYSKFLKKHIEELYNIKSKIYVSRIGADKFRKIRKVDARELNNIPLDSFIISSFGVVAPRKGYEDVIKGLVGLKKLEKDFKYFIIGGFNFMHYKLYLSNLIKRLGLDKNIVFFGYLPSDKVEEYMIASDLIIQPRKFSNEGASASLATTLFSGNPIITANIGGISEYILNNETGILIEHSPNSYNIKIEQLYKDRQLARKIGRNAKKWAEEHLSWDRIAKKHLDLYSIIDKS